MDNEGIFLIKQDGKLITDPALKANSTNHILRSGFFSSAENHSSDEFEKRCSKLGDSKFPKIPDISRFHLICKDL